MMDFVIKLAISSLLGSAIGIQRELKDRPAGLRTHALVALASCLYTFISLNAARGGDPTRVISNVAVGIGFIGAGTIIKQGNIIIGLTTASSLWAVAAIGIFVGASMYYHALAATLAALTILVVFKEVEERFGKKRVVEYKLRLSPDASENLFLLQKELCADEIEIVYEKNSKCVHGISRVRSQEEAERIVKAAREYGELIYQRWL